MYAQRDSFLHRLNPLSKIAATAPTVIFLALSTDPFTPVPFVVLGAVVTLALGNVPPREYLRVTAPLLLAMAGLALLYRSPSLPRRPQAHGSSSTWGGSSFGRRAWCWGSRRPFAYSRSLRSRSCSS